MQDSYFRKCRIIRDAAINSIGSSFTFDSKNSLSKAKGKACFKDS